MNDGFVYWSGEVTRTRLHLTYPPPFWLHSRWFMLFPSLAVWFPKHVERAPSRGRAGELTKCSANWIMDRLLVGDDFKWPMTGNELAGRLLVSEKRWLLGILHISGCFHFSGSGQQLHFLSLNFVHLRNGTDLLWIQKGRTEEGGGWKGSLT